MRSNASLSTTHTARQLLMFVVLAACLGWLAAWSFIGLCLMPIVMLLRRARIANKAHDKEIEVDNKRLPVQSTTRPACC